MLLIVIVVLIAALMGLGAGFLLGRGLVHRRRWFYAALGLILIGLTLTVYGAEKVRAGWQHRHWPSTPGTILDSRIEGVRAFHPEVVYEYSVGGVTFRDSTVLHQPSFGGHSKRYDVAVKEAALYVPGETVPVFYDPSAPERSDLVTSIFWADYATTGVGAVLLGLGVCLWLLWVRRRPAGTDSSLNASHT